MTKLCKSCSGPLNEFDPKDLIHPDFCPFCVDEKGEIKSYKDILDVMIEYIQSDHPEVKEENREEKAKEFLLEGPVWSEEWSGTIIEESLEDKSILKDLEVLSSEESIDDDPAQNHGFPTWTIIKVKVKRIDIEEVVRDLSRILKEGKWWCDFNNGVETYIVFRNKIFKGKLSDLKFKLEVNEYAKSLDLPSNQLPFTDVI
jgi:hypothetical protein